jgi:catechol 2,3-dioxygenase-like lactoylglutathione lyase family enzyme
MAITLNHTIVPAHDKEASAKFFAQIFGLKYEGAMGHFAPVRVNETLALDFDNWDRFEMHHYAFHLSDSEFDAIFDRIKGAGIPYGSGPFSQNDMQINTRRGGRGVYFKDPNGHVLELLTRT